MAKATVRIPLDVPPELREYFLGRVKRVDHTLGLNPALRFLMTSICEVPDNTFSEFLEIGKMYERQIEQGELDSYRDLYSEPPESPQPPREREEIIFVLRESVKELEKQLNDTKDFLSTLQEEKPAE